MTNQKQFQVPAEYKPYLVAFLNLFFGLGYWYKGYKRVWKLPTLIFSLLLLVAYTVGSFLLTFYVTGLGGFLIFLVALVFAYDGFQKESGKPGLVEVGGQTAERDLFGTILLLIILSVIAYLVTSELVGLWICSGYAYLCRPGFYL